MKNIVFSIPVHEQFDVVCNQLDNIRKFVDNSKVVVHVSADSAKYLFLRLEEVSRGRYKDFLYVNPNRLRTYSPVDAGNVTGLTTVHASNFRFISQEVEFNTLAIDTSNDFFVRKGINGLFDEFDCGFNIVRYAIETANLEGRHREFVDRISKYITVKTLERGPQEGSFYPKHVFAKISNIVLDQMGGMVKDEEGHLPMIAFNCFPELYDSCARNYVHHDASQRFISEEDILNTRSGKYEYKYSVKRVPRDMNHPLRIYVNELTKND